MSVVTVRNLTLGDGHCRIIVPVVDPSPAAILRSAAAAAAAGPDLVEWRADWFDAVWDRAALLGCLRGIRAVLKDLPLLVTFRTQQEGGRRPAAPNAYEDFCRTVCESGFADLLDLELFTEEAARGRILRLAHQCSVKVVCSSHDFSRTPPREEMLARLCRMQALGADVAKLAVMPRSRRDVVDLLAVTAEMADLHPQTPVITMSMGPLGQVSRVAGGLLGSAATFAALGSVSAPGQLSLQEARAALNILAGSAC